MDARTRLEGIKANIKKAETAKITAETQVGTCNTQIAEVEQRMAAEGVTPDTIEAEIAKLDTTINDDLVKVEKLVPQV